MPLSAAGTKTLANMQQQYGAKKGKRVFYASINKGKLKGMERRRPRKSSAERVYGK